MPEMKLATTFCRPKPIPTPTGHRDQHGDHDQRDAHDLADQDPQRRRQLFHALDAFVEEVAGRGRQPQQHTDQECALQYAEQRQPEVAQLEAGAVQDGGDVVGDAQHRCRDVGPGEVGEHAPERTAADGLRDQVDQKPGARKQHRAVEQIGVLGAGDGAHDGVGDEQQDGEEQPAEPPQQRDDEPQHAGHALDAARPLLELRSNPAGQEQGQWVKQQDQAELNQDRGLAQVAQGRLGILDRDRRDLFQQAPSG